MILAGLLLAFSLVTIISPKFSLGILLLFLPTYLIRFSFQNIPTTFLELLLVIFIIAAFVRNFAKIPELKSLGPINWFILLFVLAAIISTVISPDKRSALGVLKAFIIEPVLFVYAVKLTLRRTEDLTTPLNLLFLGGIIISVLGIIQYFTFIDLPLKFWGTGVEVERIVSVFEYPNALALYLAPLIAFFLSGFLFDEKILNRKNLAIGIVLMVIGLILTFSRGAWLALTLTSFILLFMRYSWKRVVVFALILLGIVLALPATRQRLLLITNDSSSFAHAQLMTAALNKITQSPILGNGLFGFRTTLIEQHFQGEVLNYPHNIFFNFWLEMGILGLISFFGIIFIAANRYKLNRNWYVIGAVAYLLTMIVHGLVDVPYFKNDLAVLFWFMISIFYI